MCSLTLLSANLHHDKFSWTNTMFLKVKIEHKLVCVHSVQLKLHSNSRPMRLCKCRNTISNKHQSLCKFPSYMNVSFQPSFNPTLYIRSKKKGPASRSGSSLRLCLTMILHSTTFASFICILAIMNNCKTVQGKEAVASLEFKRLTHLSLHIRS